MDPPSVAIVGGGPAGLMAAEILAIAGVRVTVFEHMPSVGRKLLLAGRGGLNITHTETLESLLDRYGSAREQLAPSIRAFGPEQLRAWCAGLGEDPFVGSSGRVFPSGFRATQLLRAWLVRLDSLGVSIRTQHRWTGWAPGIATSSSNRGQDRLTFTDADDHTVAVAADAVVLAMGGASWPRVGSDGAWAEHLRNDDVEVSALRPSNCGFDVAWTDNFLSRFSGTPLKNVRLVHHQAWSRGEAMITDQGLEGGAVYALSSALRDAIDRDGDVVIDIDLHPDLSVDALRTRLLRRRAKDSASTTLRRVGISPVGIGLIRESTRNRIPDDAAALARLIKSVPIRLIAAQSLDRAISTAGGVSFDEIDDSFMLRRRPGTFVAGEMLDWEAPTGGYLLQATFSTGVAAAHGVLDWLAEGVDSGFSQAVGDER